MENQYHVKTSHLGVINRSGYTPRNDSTPDRYTVLLALNNRTGLMFIENEGHFVSMSIEEVPDEGMV